MTTRPLFDILNGRRYANNPGRSDADCPYCGRESTVFMGDSRSYGFRSATHARHVFACYEKALAKNGLMIGKYVEKHMRMSIVPLEKV